MQEKGEKWSGCNNFLVDFHFHIKLGHVKILCFLNKCYMQYYIPCCHLCRTNNNKTHKVK